MRQVGGWRRTIAYAAGLLCAVLVGLAAYLAVVLLPLPSPRDLRSRALAPSSVITDRDGRLLYEMMDPHLGLHRPVPLDQVPLHLQRAIIATEDASFYENPGISLVAIARAVWLNLRSGQIVSGGSTITQQLARNLLMESPEREQRSWQRKLREAALAYRLSRALPKEEILALYLNETYFGNMAYGVDAAAQSYFAKPVAQLDLAECAMLAGLPQAPGRYNPHLALAAAKQRQETVLGLMVKSGYITAEDAELALREPLQLASEPFTIEAPHLVMAVRAQLDALLDADTIAAGGLHITTTLDLGLQHAAEGHIVRHLASLNKATPTEPAHGVRNAAVVVLDPNTGAVRALVGSPDYFDALIGGAVNAAVTLRQPGSAIKPLTYAAAFERGYSPATMICDVRSSFVTHDGYPYQPINYDYRFHGPVFLREALACSYNVSAVRLLEQLGPEALAEIAHRMGITTLTETDRHDLALTLGGCEVSLMELSAAYGALANGGHRVTPWFIERIAGPNGQSLYEHPSSAMQPVLDERVSYLVTDVLSDNRARFPAFGEGSPLELPFQAAVKTGTTTEWRDNWTVGYSSQWVVGVWVGNADNKPMQNVSGVSGAAPIWNAVMRSAHQRYAAPIPRPGGLIDVEVCALSGSLPNEACTHHKRELFLAENAPTQRCALHRTMVIDSLTGQLAGPDTPAERSVARPVTLWPQEALSWAAEQGLPLPPTGKAGADAGQQALALEAKAGERREISTALRFARPAPNSRFALVPDIPLEMQQIEVAATARVALRELVLWIDEKPWCTLAMPPYSTLWPLSPGEHLFQLRGVAADGQAVSSSPMSVFVIDRTTTDGVGPERNAP